MEIGTKSVQTVTLDETEVAFAIPIMLKGLAYQFIIEDNLNMEQIRSFTQIEELLPKKFVEIMSNCKLFVNYAFLLHSTSQNLSDLRAEHSKKQ